MDTNSTRAPKVSQAKRTGAFTLPELLIVIALMVILAGGILLPAISRPKTTHAPRIRCISNLKNVGLSFRIFAADNNDRFPMTVPMNEGGSKEAVGKPLRTFYHYFVMSNILSTPKLLVCPSDNTRTISTIFATNVGTTVAAQTVPFECNRNISYFVGTGADETAPSSILAGDRNLTNSGAPLVMNPHTNIAVSTFTRFSTNSANAGWTTQEIHKSQGDVAWGDGSVTQMNTRDVQKALRSSVETNNWLQLPGDELRGY